MTPEISVIVPVYNSTKYLDKCVNSILDQSFRGIELILVNDGSTDESGSKCEAYSRLDNRCKVVHKNNEGIASARNAGLKVANGRYIGFVDADDFIHKDMYEILYRNIKEQSADLAICEFKSIYNYDDVDEKQEKVLEGSIKNLTNIQALNQLYAKNAVTYIYPWNKLYRRTLFDNLKYDHGKNYDDEFIAHKLLYSCQKIIYIDKQLYYYYQRQGSMVRSPFTIQKLDRVYALCERIEFFKNNNLTDLHSLALKQYMDVFFWYYFYAKNNLQNIDGELKDLKQTFHLTYLNLLELNQISLKQKIMLSMFRLNPSWFERVKRLKER